MEVSTRISSDRERCVSEEFEMLLPEHHKPPLNVNLLLITKWGKLIVGHWKDEDCIEWHALPKRSTKRKQQGELNDTSK